MSAARGEQERLLDGPLADGLPSIMAAAHELKSPLALIRQLSLMLEDGAVTKSDRARMLRQISLTSEQALRLTSNLTQSVRLSDAMFKLEPINPQQLCEDIVRELKPLFEEHNRSFRVSRNRKQLLLVANRDLLRRIVTNFSENALHYSETNNPVEIIFGLNKSGETVRLGVRDYGPALANDVLDAIKARLAGAPASVYARPASSGLGIFMASQFAEAMNGRVGVTRHRDGSTFFVDLQASRQLSLL